MTSTHLASHVVGSHTSDDATTFDTTVDTLTRLLSMAAEDGGRGGASTVGTTSGSALFYTLVASAHGYSGSTEPGLDSDWLRTVRRSMRSFGLPILTAVEEAWNSGQIDAHATADAFAEIGRMDNLPLRRRREVLLRALKSSSAVVRDGAAVGLAASGDRSVSDELRQAAHREPMPILRAFFKEIADELSPGA